VSRVKEADCGEKRFRRTLYGETLQQWEEMKMLVDGVQLRDEADRVRWKIG
jgi:hypothetical protein